MDVNGGGDSAHKRKHIVWNEENLSYNEANKSVRGGLLPVRPRERGSPIPLFTRLFGKKKKTLRKRPHEERRVLGRRERKVVGSDGPRHLSIRSLLSLSPMNADSHHTRAAVCRGRTSTESRPTQPHHRANRPPPPHPSLFPNHPPSIFGLSWSSYSYR